MKYWIFGLTIIAAILISGCVQQKEVQISEGGGETIPSVPATIDVPSFKQQYNLSPTDLTFQAPPRLRGMNYFAETMDGLQKEDNEIKNDFKIIHQVLNVDAVRLWGFDSSVFRFVDFAHQEGLEVWLTYQPFFEFPEISEEAYRTQFASFAMQADQHNTEVLFVGNELPNWASQSIKSGDLRKFINDLSAIARKNYKGQITYATDDWEGGEANWGSFDVISINAYLGMGKPEDYANAIKNTKAKFSKPLFITEVGSLTISDAEKGGGDYSYVLRTEARHDGTKQANEIKRQLDLIYQTGIDGVFVFTWDENAQSQEFDKNKFGYGIWDYVEKRPKQSFFEVYKYFTAK